MTSPIFPADAGVDTPVPMTRRQMRERERAAEAAAVASSDAKAGTASGVQVVQGSAPLYTSRRAMRETATKIARDLPVTPASEVFEAPVITTPAPALGDTVTRAPRVVRPLAPRTIAARRPIQPETMARGSRGSVLRRTAQKLTAAGALLFIGSLVVVTSLPAQAFVPEDLLEPTVGAGPAPTGSQTVSIQAGTAASLTQRDDFTVNDAVATEHLTPDELARYQSLADSQTTGSSYGGKPRFPAAWAAMETSYTQSPFPTLGEVRVSSGFGGRGSGFHGGVDLTPGVSTPIFPIANGVVSEVYQGNNPGGGGYTVFIDHNIDGKFYQSWYAHMQPGSINVQVGQVVDITTQVGLVGSSGRSTGPHLHLEIKNDSYTSFSPVLWLQTREFSYEP